MGGPGRRPQDEDGRRTRRAPGAASSGARPRRASPAWVLPSVPQLLFNSQSGARRWPLCPAFRFFFARSGHLIRYRQHYLPGHWKTAQPEEKAKAPRTSSEALTRAEPGAIPSRAESLQVLGRRSRAQGFSVLRVAPVCPAGGRAQAEPRSSPSSPCNFTLRRVRLRWAEVHPAPGLFCSSSSGWEPRLLKEASHLCTATYS